MAMRQIDSPELDPLSDQAARKIISAEIARDSSPPLNMSSPQREGVVRDNEVAENSGRVDAARWNEERYRTLFDLGPVAVYSCNAAGVIQEYNRRAAELWGREPAAGDTDERFCGSFKLFRPDGRFVTVVRVETRLY